MMNRKDINIKSESAMKETDMAMVPEPTWGKKGLSLELAPQLLRWSNSYPQLWNRLSLTPHLSKWFTFSPWVCLKWFHADLSLVLAA
jgi:hypothetical protein